MMAGGLKGAGLGMALALAAFAVPATAQWTGGIDRTGGPDRTGGSGVSYGDAVGAAILSDVASDRQAERDARRTPHATPGYGSISTAKAARQACSARALGQAGGKARLSGVPAARTMSTGWEVEGRIDAGEGRFADFVCSVRNGSVTGVLLK